MNLLVPECVHFRTYLPGSLKRVGEYVETDPRNRSGNDSLNKYDTEIEHEQAYNEGRGRIHYPPPSDD